MKKNYILFTLFVFFISYGFGQGYINLKIDNHNVKIKESVSKNSKSTDAMVYLNDSSIAYAWDNNNNLWDAHWKSYNTFDNNGNLTLIIHYMKDYTTFEFKIHEKNTYFYNSSNQLIEEMFSWWDNSLNNWLDGQKTYHTYNSQGKILRDSTLNYDQTALAWIIDSKTMYEYDNNGNLSLSTNYSWNGNLWEKQSKEEYVNNSNGKPITVYYYMWNSNSNIWEYSYKTTITYNLSNGEIAEMEGFNWNATASTWDKQTKMSYSYNSNNKLSEIIYYYWSTSAYVLSSKFTFDYDSNGNEIENMMYSWNSSTSTWGYNSKTNNYWSLHQVSSIIQPSIAGSTLYPNPAKDFVIIDGLNTPAEVQIFSIDGKLIQAKKIENNRLDVGNLSKGVYIISYTENGYLKQKKVIKQ
jgi:hypothetical protein